MSYSSNFYNNFPQFTFQNLPPTCIPPPPLPPSFMPPTAVPPLFIPPMPVPNSTDSDQAFIKHFDKPVQPNPSNQKSISISIAKEKLQNLILTLNNLKIQQKHLSENIHTLSESEWSSTLEEIEKNKHEIKDTMGEITSYLDILTKLLAKRSAKRVRMNKLRLEQKKEKEEHVKKIEERSRKIDESIQKIKDDIKRAKQEEEYKLQADIVLKEVLRKKHDAKKYLIKLDAMIKLRRARQNTAKGRGESVVERDAEVFNNNIEKLKQLWTEKLSLYDKEEMDLRATLEQDTEGNIQNEKVREVVDNLDEWREFLFDGELPQVNFNGDVNSFVLVRSKWDQYINEEGTSLPVGWVTPKTI